MVELRSDHGEVLSLDYDTEPPGAYLGRSVRLDDLQLTGLRDEAAKDEKGRSFNCPNCGAPVEVNSGRQQERHLPLVQRASSTSRRASAASCGMRRRTSRCSR